MTSGAKELANGFLEMRAVNPSPDNLHRRFKLYLSANGLLKKYTEKDIMEAAVAVGVSPDDAPDLLASLGATL